MANSITNLIIGELTKQVINKVTGQATSNATTTPSQISNNGFDLSDIITTLNGGKLTETADKIVEKSGVDTKKELEENKSSSDVVSNILKSVGSDEMQNITSAIINAVTKK